MADLATLRWIEEIVRNELDKDDVRLSMDTLPSDVEGWDSLAHVGIIVAIETGIGRQFTTDEIEGLKSVGDLVRLVGQV